MWDQRYDTDQYIYGTKPNDFLAAQIDALPSAGKVLCLADGEGRNGVFLASRGHRVTSVDASAVGLNKARQLAASMDVEIETIVADLAQFDLGQGRWDAIVSIYCHLPPSLRQQVHAAAVQALAPGGVMLLEAYTPAQLQYRTGGPPVEALMMTADGLRQEFEGLDFEILHEIERDVVEGVGHKGHAAVVQVVARKKG